MPVMHQLHIDLKYIVYADIFTWVIELKCALKYGTMKHILRLYSTDSLLHTTSMAGLDDAQHKSMGFILKKINKTLTHT